MEEGILKNVWVYVSVCVPFPFQVLVMVFYHSNGNLKSCARRHT